MPVGDLVEWLDEHGAPAFVWYVKRLSGNDTLANGSHQAGPYIPRDFLFEVFPGLNRPEVKNPDVHFNLYVDSHADHREVRAIWYNNRFHDTSAARGRDETRGHWVRWGSIGPARSREHRGPHCLCVSPGPSRRNGRLPCLGLPARDGRGSDRGPGGPRRARQVSDLATGPGGPVRIARPACGARQLLARRRRKSPRHGGRAFRAAPISSGVPSSCGPMPAWTPIAD